MNPRPIVRGGDEAEMPALLALLRQAWPEESSLHFVADPWFDPSQFRVVEIDGHIVSMAKIYKRPIVWGRSEAMMGGIGDVVTHPEHRRRGYAAMVLQDACRYMFERGYDLSLLFTGLPLVYQGLGWVTIPQPSFVIELRGPLPARPDCYRVRRFDVAGDLEAVSNIYLSENGRRLGTVVRSSAYWRAQLAWKREDPDAFLVAEDQGRVVGYLRCQVVGGEHQLTECACVVGEEACYIDMLARLLRRAVKLGAARLVMLIPPDSRMRQTLSRYGVVMHADQMNAMMGRVINRQTLARKLDDGESLDTKDLVARAGHFFFWRQDSF